MADRPPLAYHGKPPTSAMLLDLWQRAEKRFGGLYGRDDRIRKVQALVRGTDRPKIHPGFIQEHPEVDADSAISILPERESYIRDLVAKVGSVEPKVAREPLDVTETAVDHAEEYEAYMREVAFDAEHGVPLDDVYSKLAEDGECGVTALPAHLDAEGIPDFYDRLSERARAALKSDERRQYTPDDNDRRGRYVRRNADGTRATNPRYERDAKGRTRKDAEKADGRGSFKADRATSREAHADAVRRYLLRHNATTFRVIPALDCYPILGRGTGRSRWKLEGLIERSLFSREELIEKQYGWAMAGDRLLLPRGVPMRYAGVKDELYLYTAYLMLRAEDDEDGVAEHPCILYTIGGAGTWWDGMEPRDDAGRRSEVAIIDLYEEFKITGRRWDYGWGLHTADDDPSYYGRPALWPFVPRIRQIETLETAAGVQVQLEAYTGHYYKPDATLAEKLPEAVIDTRANRLRKPVKPGPGAMEPFAGDVVPFNQAQIGKDHYLLHDTYLASLKEGMAVDAIRGETGNAMMISASQGQVSKRHIRETALRLFRFWLEADALNRLAAYKCHEVRWPILTSRERPVGHEVRSRLAPVEFDPDWLGEDENPKLEVTYGDELNLARADLEMNAADRGYRALKHVAAAFGEDDPMSLRYEIAKDQMWKDPQNQLLLRMMVDSRRQMTRQRQAAMLQAEGKMTKQGLPGAPNGAPASMFNRAGQAQARNEGQAAGSGRPPYAASVRGGVNSGARQADAAALQAGASAGAA